MSEQQRPNLLFIFTDQQRLDTLACYGNTKIHMPNLNRLAERSVVFEQPHCTQPVCTPGRGSLMTGLWPHAHGAPNNNIPIHAESRCLPELLPAEARKEYRTGYMGKWHLGDEIFRQHGFDEWVSVEDMYKGHYGPERDRSLRSSYHHFLLDAGFQPDGPTQVFGRDFACHLAERYSKPHFLGSEASRFIRDNREQPWMLVVNFLEPHTPFYSCRDRQYHPDEVDVPDNIEGLFDESAPKYGKHKPQTMKELRETVARYWGLNSLVDTHVGRILDTLDATGQRDNTIIVFTSDHGEMMGSHGLMHKCVMYKESTRVPLLLQIPGQKAQGRIAGPVSHIDLAPTLLDLMGFAESGAHLPGKSLVPLCREASSGKTVSAESAASDCVVEWNPGHQPIKTAVRTILTHEQERYSHYTDGEHEYYDLKDDPREMHNRAAEPALQSRIRELRKRLAAWQNRVGDTADPIQLD